MMGASKLLRKVPFWTTSVLLTLFSNPRFLLFTVKRRVRSSPGRKGEVKR